MRQYAVANTSYTTCMNYIHEYRKQCLLQAFKQFGWHILDTRYTGVFDMWHKSLSHSFPRAEWDKNKILFSSTQPELIAQKKKGIYYIPREISWDRLCEVLIWLMHYAPKGVHFAAGYFLKAWCNLENGHFYDTSSLGLYMVGSSYKALLILADTLQKTFPTAGVLLIEPTYYATAIIKQSDEQSRNEIRQIIKEHPGEFDTLARQRE